MRSTTHSTTLRTAAPLHCRPQIKQNVLLKYKYLVTFLRQSSRDIFAEVG